MGTRVQVNGVNSLIYMVSSGKWPLNIFNGIKKSTQNPNKPKYSGPLNNTNLNCMGRLMSRFFFPVNLCTVFNLQSGFHRSRGLTICITLFYIGEHIGEFGYLWAARTKLLREEPISSQPHRTYIAWFNMSHLIETQQMRNE